jgi:hypothetical protein
LSRKQWVFTFDRTVQKPAKNRPPLPNQGLLRLEGALSACVFTHRIPSIHRGLRRLKRSCQDSLTKPAFLGQGFLTKHLICTRPTILTRKPPRLPKMLKVKNHKSKSPKIHTGAIYSGGMSKKSYNSTQSITLKAQTVDPPKSSQIRHEPRFQLSILLNRTFIIVLSSFQNLTWGTKQ